MHSNVLNSPLHTFQPVLADLFSNIIMDVNHGPLAQVIRSKELWELIENGVGRGLVFFHMLYCKCV